MEKKNNFNRGDWYKYIGRDTIYFKKDEIYLCENTTSASVIFAISNGDTATVSLGFANHWFVPNVQESPTPPTNTIPNHYDWFKEKFGIEPRKILEQFTFNIGCSMKYLIRHGRKKSMSMNEREKTIDDLKKAIDYINFEIERLS